MLAVMATASMAVFAVSVLAPEAAPSLGVDPSSIGFFTALVYVCAMFSGTITGAFVARYGALRVCQCTLLATAIAMMLFSQARLPLVLASALLLGIAYGALNPASAHVLMELGKTRWQPLIFSIKQTGIPLGGALAGALLPTVVSSASWQVAALAVATLALVVAALTQPLRQRLDAGREAGRTLAGISVARPLRAVFGQRTLRAATLVAFAYAGCQVSVGAFFVVYLVHDLGMDLVHAGWIFAAVQAGGICGRLLWGALASRLVAPRLMLGAVGLLTACCLALSAALTRTLGMPLLLVHGFVLGASSFGWNGVFLAEVARLAPAGKSSEITGGVQFVMFGGVVVVPPVFGTIVALGHGYPSAFIVVAAIAAAAGLYLLNKNPIGEP